MWGAYRTRAKRGCNCVEGVPVVSFVDAIAGISAASKIGIGATETICCPDSQCASTMANNTTFHGAPDATVRASLLASHTVSAFAKFTALSGLRYLVSYTTGAFDASGAQNYLVSLRCSTVFGNLWESGTGVDRSFYSTFVPQLDVWYLFSARMTFTGLNVVCELLVDGEVVGTSGTLVGPTGGTSSFISVGGYDLPATNDSLVGAMAFVDFSSVLRSDTYLKNLRAFGRDWGRDSGTVARLVPTT